MDLKTLTYDERIEAIVAGQTSLSGNSILVAMLMRSFRPVIPAIAGEDNATSADIVEYLEGVCPVSEADVAATMLALGYQFYLNDYSDGCEWAMKRI